MSSLFKKIKIEDCDWYCDTCGAFLNSQDGFYYLCDTWKCTNCGSINYIDEDHILNNDSYDDDTEYFDSTPSDDEFL